MKNILVACDFSTIASHACRFAIEIASVTGGKVLVANIIDQSSAEGDDRSQYTYKEQISILSELMEKAENDFENFRNNIDIEYDKVSFSVEVGSFKDITLKIINEQKIDLLITGAAEGKGFTGRDLKLESDKTGLPVHILIFILYRATTFVSDVKNILLVLLKSDDLTVDVLDKIKVLQNHFHAEIHIVDEIKELNANMESSITAIVARNKTDLLYMLKYIASNNNAPEQGLWTYLFI